MRALALADGTVTTRGSFALPPIGVAADGSDVLVTTGDHRVVRIDAGGTISTVAGLLNQSGFVDGAAGDARFFRPAGLWVESGRVLVADDGNYAVRAIAKRDSAVTTILGAVSAGARDGSGADARFFVPQGLAVAGTTAYVADTDNHTIRAVDLGSGAVTTLAGHRRSGHRSPTPPAATRASTRPSASRSTTAAGGSSSPTAATARSASSSWRPARSRRCRPTALPARCSRASTRRRAWRATAAPLRQRRGRPGRRSRSTSPPTSSPTVAGSARIAGANDGVGMKARFNGPSALAADGNGALYVADTLNDVVRRIDVASGTVITVAGVLGVSGSDDGDAGAAHFNQPGALAVDAVGDLFVGDTLNGLVRHVDLAHGFVNTVVGAIGKSGVQVGPLPAQIGPPTALALTPDAHLLIVSENSLLEAH